MNTRKKAKEAGDTEPTARRKTTTDGELPAPSERAGNEASGSDLKHVADAQLSALAGGIAHDLNTIITTIYGYCEAALESAGNSAETDLNIRRIIGAADRAKMLTGQLLDLSRRASSEKVPVRVAAVLVETIDFLRPSVPEGIRIKSRITAPDAIIKAVPAQLFRIFFNLTINAIQAMSTSGGTLTVTLGCHKRNDEAGTGDLSREIVIRFTDTGKGMDEVTVSRIFRPFVSVGKENGTGLGLTVVSDAVRELGGTVTVSSAVGEGSTFEMIIPGAFFGTVPENC